MGAGSKQKEKGDHRYNNMQERYYKHYIFYILKKEKDLESTINSLTNAL